MKNTYGKDEKKIVFADTDKRHADLRIRLRYDGITQVQFFQSIITGYLNKDSRIVEYIRSVKEKLAKQGKRKISKSHSLYEQGEYNKRLFKLSEEETEEIFDIIAQELYD
mgnify:CR=1 FL=1|tara:strand:- start:277 stop:606 length:330 start_codon:yes stop_codon:yes gene_type:complete